MRLARFAIDAGPSAYVNTSSMLVLDLTHAQAGGSIPTSLAPLTVTKWMLPGLPAAAALSPRWYPGYTQAGGMLYVVRGPACFSRPALAIITQ